MSDKTNMLGNLGTRIRDGLSRMNQDAKDKAEGKKASTTTENDNVGALDEAMDEALSPENHSNEKDRLSAVPDDEIDDALIIEMEPQDQKPKPKGLDKKQKLLVIGAMVVFGIYWQFQSPAPMPTESAGDDQAQSGGQLEASAGDDVAGPTFDLGGSSDQEAPIPITSSTSSEDQLGFGESGDAGKDAANDPIGTDLLTADLDEQLTSLGDDGNEILDPFTGKVKTEPAATLQVTDAKKKTPEPALNLEAELGLLGASEANPFAAPDSKSTELGGTQVENADSRSGELKDQVASADVANLTAKLAEKDGRIGELEKEVGKLKTDLAKAKEDVAKLNTRPNPNAKTAIPQPAKPTAAAQRSPSTQRVASAPKAIARPRICVTAVAQAARNCTTCVPHAFITHRGVEDMVGQGDFIEGLRVNIVGDRLDLQNAKGDVVHKFWSSPNGCAAG
ncbi:hypothetical protein [Pseudomonas aeruginosa]|uniref:hypothetical protein n=1 Tax=Pseudomonas aeruginosa TaxID=287 RepID=UPI0034E0CABC